MGFELERQNRQIRHSTGYMPEDDCFWYGLSGIESVQLSAELSRLPRLEALRRSHEILDFCGVGQERYRKVETYSTGMRQKMRFAQAIVHDPPLIILDEPTSGLDPEEREAMLGRIRVLANEHGKAILLCTHILPDVQAVSHAVIILARGRVQIADRLEKLSHPSSPSIHARLVGEANGFVDALRRQRLEVEVAGEGVVVSGDSPDQLARRVWQVAREAGVGIRSLEPARNSLETIFLNAVREQPNGRT
jgi:ABC-2 type transport system ATP-binding protein